MVNVLGGSYFIHVRCNGIILLYFEVEQVERKFNTISIDHYQNTIGTHSLDLIFKALQDSYKIVMKLSNIKVALTDKFSIHFGENIGSSEVIIANSTMTLNYTPYIFPYFYFEQNSVFYFYSSRNGTVHFDNCNFVINYEHEVSTPYAIITTKYKITSTITNCNFSVNHIPVLSAYGDTMLTVVVIQNTIISSNKIMDKLEKYVLMVSHIRLLLSGTVIFYKTTVLNSIIVLTNKSDLVIDGNLHFTNNTALSIIDF